MRLALILFAVSLACLFVSHHSTQLRVDDLEARVAGMQPEQPDEISMPEIPQPPQQLN